MKIKIILILFLFSASAFSWSYFHSNQQPKPQTTKPAPKPVTRNPQATSETYEVLWNRIDSLQQKGLSKSTLEVVMKVYAKAKAENNPPQLVKAVIHRIKYQNYTEEDAIKKNIADMNKEIAEADVPVRQLLHSLLAETYWNFYQQNRWQFLNRTETVNYKSDDINTWDLKKIFEETVRHYKLSLTDKEVTQKVQVNAFEEILMTGTNADARKFRPSLYDFLAHRAVDFYMNDESGLTQPANAFQVNNPIYFEDGVTFVNLHFKSNDTLNFRYNALLILRDLLEFHHNDVHLGAFIDADLKRLKFVYSQFKADDAANGTSLKDSLYLRSLQRLVERNNEYPGSADALYEMVLFYSSKGDQYKAGEKEEGKWMKKKAEEICDKAIAAFPYSQGGLNCKALKSVINEKQMTFQTERVNIPGKPFLALMNYKNVSKIFLRIAKTVSDDSQSDAIYGEQLIKNYLSLPVIKGWNITLPDDGDKQNHSAEIKIPELPIGKYVILVSTSESFSYEKNSVAYTTTWVSNISFINRRLENGNYDVYVQNRLTGEPLQNVKATVYYSQYDYTSRKYDQKTGASYTSDINGYFSIPSESNYRNFDIKFVNGSDTLFLKGNFYQFRYDNRKEKHLQTFFFTDRSIYRPGQTVYYKGILIETDGESSAIKPNQKTTVVFSDVNSQKIAEQTLTTNEYGTFNGSFTTPQGVLTGQMRIQNESGLVSFSVEEYKRPKFEVTFDPLKGSFRLNELVSVTGKAVSYSGANVTDAQVKYRVVRRARFPVWMNYWQPFQPSAEMEITSGTVITDGSGVFKISFSAIPDKGISEESDPVFAYEVTADVTDVNGETHTSTQSVSVSYKALFLETDLKENINADEVKSFFIKSRNIADQFEPAKGTVTISRLEQPNRLLRERLWNKPDRHTLTKDEFEKNFPNDIYENENDVSKWKVAEQVLGQSFDTGKDSTVQLSKLSAWKKGKYVVELKSKDKYGKDVKYVRYITLFSATEKECPVNSFVWFVPLSFGEGRGEAGEPGDKAKFLIGTHDKNVRVLYEVEWKNEIVSKQFLILNDEQKLIEIPIEEKHRGNFSVHFNFVKQNRFYHFDNLITVPWTNKELAVSIETFRDKLKPGAKEEWRMKINAKNGEKVAAEMVASMYDASLDAFVPHDWLFNIYNSYMMKLGFQSGTCFGVIGSANFSKDWNIIFPTQYRKYDELNWFDAGFGYIHPGQPVYGMMQRGQAAESMAAGEPNMASQKKLEYNDIQASPVSNVNAAGAPQEVSKAEPQIAIQSRKRFDETAFFYPNLVTNEKGEIIFSFTMPDALTKWKFTGFAHTKVLKYGMIKKEVVTQKELMIIPNATRFFREGDEISFPAKITNLSDTSLGISSSISFFDALTEQNITSKILKGDSVLKITVAKGKNVSLAWNLSIPAGFSAIKYKVSASSGMFSDGEEMVLPVLTNRTLVTESMPLWANSSQTKSFKLDKLITSSTTSTTLRNHKLTLEFTSNPAWYAIQALPYLMEYPYDCSEQIFSRYYANAIASHIANSNPKIKAVFDSWKSQSPESFLSNLEKNQELKSVLLQQTPWVLDAKDESERKKRVALLFDLNKMSNELQSAVLQLQKKQLSNGAWPWFDGMPDDRYITQYIVEGFGHLDHLGVKTVRNDAATWNMTTRAIQYLDMRISEDYKKLIADKADLTKIQISSIQIHYLYARSFFKDVTIADTYKKAFDYYQSQEKKYWLQNNEYLKGMIALTLSRNNETTTANDILKSLKENSQYSEELGRYWKNNTGGYYWSQAPIETQALLIEAFHDVSNDKQTVDEMQRWLLKNKQTTNWKSTKATAEACYALLLQGTDFLAETKLAEITVGNGLTPTLSKGGGATAEAGTGYFKTSWSGNEIKPEMGIVKVVNPNKVPSYGALYWQYFEDLDKITSHETSLKLSKKIFLEQNSPTGKVITPVNDQTELKVGDRLKVRIELRSDRDMEYVMMKDMRASGTEPENVLSQYKWQDGLGYYESTHDASTDFFFANLSKGTYVFEYPLIISQSGNFSNGITTIQCMYAPEFGSHSEGVRIKVN